MRRLFASLLVTFFLIACSDDAAAPRADGGPADASTPDAALDADSPDAAPPTGELARDYCAPLAEFVCGSASDCGCGAIVPGGVLDRDACVARWTGRCMSAWQPFVDAGAGIDAAAATACVAAVRARTTTCARPDGALVFAVCAPFAVEPAALGETCTTPYCAMGEGACVGGTCVPRGVVGAPCGDMFTCATGLACNEGVCTAFGDAGAICDADLDCAPPLRCVSGQCRALADAGGSCASAAECQVGLGCVATSCAPATTTGCTTSADCGNRAECGGVRSCLPRAGAGGACHEDRDCEESLYCADGTQLCAARPTSGQACARGTICGVGLGCDGDGGTCRALPTSGQACAFGEFGPFLCADGLGCIDGSCGALPMAGATCAGDYRCADGLGCDFSPAGSICIVPRVEGGSCESDRSCATGFHCGSSGTCTADRAAGSPCSLGNECAGVCGPDASGGLACRDAPSAGEPCIFSDDCPVALACVAATLGCVPEICREL